MVLKALSTGKIIALAAGLFGTVAAVSTGAASFVISHTAQEATEGNARFGTLSDSGLDFKDVEFVKEFPGDELYDSITFDGIKDDLDGRFTYKAEEKNGVTPYEHLTVTLRGKISPSTFLKQVTVQLEVATSAGTDLRPIDDCIAAAYIELDTSTWGVGEEYETEEYDYLHHPVAVPLTKVEGSDTELQFTIVLGFKWGRFFGQMNPCEYYDRRDLPQGKVNIEGERIGGYDIPTDEAMAQTNNFVKMLHYGANYDGEISSDSLDEPELSFTAHLVGEVN